MRSTHSADLVLGRFLNDLLPELTRRAVAQRFVRMHAVIMLEPGIERAQQAGRVWLRTDPGLIPFEGGFRHAVRLWALDRRRARHQADVSRQGAGVAGD